MNQHLRLKTTALLLLSSLFLLWLTACGTVTAPPQEGTVIEEDQVTLLSDPSPPVAGQETELRVELGAPLHDDIRMDIEIRKEGSARGKFIKTEPQSKQVYTATEAFQDSGTYRVFIHIYSSEIHQIMEKRMEVS